MHKKIEIACSNIESCLNAEQGGADRIELFENLTDGGCTPSFGMMRMAKEKTTIPVYAMIRPRGGDFIYTDVEFKIMVYDVILCHELEIDGIVFGILDANRQVDIKRSKILLDFWKNKNATFHRAIDMTTDMEKSCREIIDLGFERILTSGGKPTAEEGIDMLLDMNQKFGNQISIMPGSGITYENIGLFSEFNDIHATCKSVVSSTDLFGNYITSDLELVRKLKTDLSYIN
jgi:copper homeostasis protein